MHDSRPGDFNIVDLVEKAAKEAPAETPKLPPAEGQGAIDPRPSDAVDEDKFIDEINRFYCLVLAAGTTVIVWLDQEAPPEDQYRIISLASFNVLLQPRKVVRETCVKDDKSGEWRSIRRFVNPAKTWLSSPRRREFRGLEFHPNPDGAMGTAGYFNFYRGFSVTADSSSPDEGRWKKYSVFRDHLLTNIADGNETYFRWILAWFAHLVQRPRERIGTAIVLRGRQGTGKTVVGDVIGALIRAHYFLVDDPRYLTGNFNVHMVNCLLLQIDEGVWGGDKHAEGRLKGLITSSNQMIEAKNVDPIRVRNFVRVIFTSNEAWVVPAGLEERRFAVFDVASHVMQNHEYFAEMFRELNAGGYEALLADLLVYDLDAPDAPNLREIPKTGGLLEQKLRSMDPVSSWWFARLVDGSPTHRQAGWPSRIPIRVLLADYIRSSDKVGVRRKASETEFGMAMQKLLPSVRIRKSVETVEETSDDGDSCEVMRRVRCYDLPGLDDCRRHVEERLAQSVEWAHLAGESEQDANLQQLADDEGPR
jgi:hypothetical protein